jgi:hypothetical protein
MKVIVSSRRAGKTYKMVEWVKQGEKSIHYPYWTRIILAHNIAEADHLRREYELDYHQVFSVDEWADRRRGSRHEPEIAVDNAEFLLTRILGSAIHQVSITGEAEILHGGQDG